MMSFSYVLTLLLASTTTIGAFSPQLHLWSQLRLRCHAYTNDHITRLLASAKKDEIARLEEEIRKLREEASTESLDVEESAESAFAAARALSDKKRLLAQVKGKDMLLTEGALIKENILEDESSTSTVGLLPAILGAFLAVGVIAFSQLPVGQEELSRYSVQSGPTVSTKIDLGDINPDQPRP
jgi:hypothetical protein